MSIQKRKKEHVDLSVNQQVAYDKSAGFNQFDFLHNALPEINVSDVDLTARFLNREFSFPLFISSMTGGYAEAGAVNTIIAEFCEEKNLPFGVGSQRVMLEDPQQVESFSIVRSHAPTAFIAANIGGAQLIGGLEEKKIRMMIDSIEADAVIVHLNPLQELMQQEGDRKFSGIEDGIADLIKKVECPVIVKETGAGISSQVAQRLLDHGVSVIDVAGAGGTSWAKVENLRDNQMDPMHEFDDWGLSTVECICQVDSLRTNYSFEMIASGGIRSAFDILKAMALGADFTASAQPIIKAIVEGGFDSLDELFCNWEKQARYILTLVGCSKIDDLKPNVLIKRT
ncbi:type 2 isopentenyl-diphosphate Delta-isomerase [Rhodohalobacter sp. 614A]|uniref:type 2 isopentenyl-diphosphate Delta-isomerase n=1 Tax=Rhodohalobacter sp. 614A TaxID=2908649 RepID=UPI001F1699E0|nr:type 2 isopentenyl-diphosphate Delta-isomerase [Rhodohalobacter sp. 614A]